MPAGSPLKNWVLGAVVIAALLACALLLRHGGRPDAPARPEAARGVGGAARKSHWLVTERAVEPSPALKELQARYQAAPDDETRTFNIAAAAKLGEPAAVVWLAELAAKETRPGGTATRALGQITNRDSNLELGDVATSDGPAPVRVAAIVALVATGDLAQAAQLAALVADGNQPLPVRQAAATTLGQMRRPGAVPALTAVLEDPPGGDSREGQQLRVAAAQALGLIGTPEARAALEAHAKGALAPPERAAVEAALRLPPH